MRLLTVFFFMTLIAISTQATAQNYVVSGTVKDAATGETLLGANIYLESNTSEGVQSNNYGFYSLTTPAGTQKIICSYIGYENFVKVIEVAKNEKLTISLVPVGVKADEVTITADRKDENVTSTQMGTLTLEIDKIKTLPAFMGEVDILKTVQLLPGIKNGGDGSTGFFVRGGGADQNLILLDDAVVYNTGHMLGFFSVFNVDAIKNTTVIKGNMPSQYGGRLSSVLDVTMKEGNNKRLQVEGGIGAIASRLTIQGPIQKDKSSFIVSARRTYVFDVVQPFVSKTKFKGTNYYFYDLNTKANFILTPKDRIYFSGYFGRDVLKFNSNDRGFGINVPYGNTTATLRWNHIISSKWFLNTTAVYNDYKFAFTGKQDAFTFKLSSGIQDWNLKMDFDYAANAKHYVKMGASYTFHTFTPNTASATIGETDFKSNEQKRYAHEVALYINDDYKINKKITANIGVRVPFYQQVGPYDNIQYDSTYIETNRTTFAKGKPVITYKSVEPRININYRLSATSSLKAGYSFNNQFIHLVTSAASTLPTDLWIPSTLKVKPQQGHQYAVGYFRNFDDNTYEASVETYYKKMLNQIEYKEGYYPQINVDTDESFTFGKGEAFGVELLLKKNKGKLTGWIGYTLSKTQRFFPQLNGGRVFQASYDRRHDISVVAMYPLGKRWELGGAFIYYTGRAFTLANGLYTINNWIATQYTERNGYRLIPYHRIDLSATWKAKETRKLKQSITIAVYNAYNRLNQDFIYFSPESTPTGFTTKAFQVSIFPIIPSVTYNFKF